MSLIEKMKQEYWKCIYALDDKKSSDHEFVVIISEFTGGSIDFNRKKISERSSFIVLIPMISIHINSIEHTNILSEMIKSDFRKYEHCKLPITLRTSKNVKAKLVGNELDLRFNKKDKYLNKKIYLTDKEKIF